MEIPLYHSDKVALIDDADYSLVRDYKWSAHNIDGRIFYARATTGNGLVIMHRLLCGVFDRNQEVDHINGDGLCNYRENLRVVTHAQQMQNRRLHRNNTSGVRGVSWSSVHQRWRGLVTLNSRVVFEKYFRDIEVAKVKTQEARLKYFTHTNEDTERLFLTN